MVCRLIGKTETHSEWTDKHRVTPRRRFPSPEDFRGPQRGSAGVAFGRANQSTEQQDATSSTENEDTDSQRKTNEVKKRNLREIDPLVFTDVDDEHFDHVSTLSSAIRVNRADYVVSTAIL